MTNTKAQVGDLIRIVEPFEADVYGYSIGDILEVACRRNDEDVFAYFEDAQVIVSDCEYEIHRKAGEEDSEVIDVTDGVNALLADWASGDCECQTQGTEPSKWSDTQPNLIRQAGAELTDLLVRKNHDYGDSFAQQHAKYGLMSALIRMDDKMRRLETLLDSEEQAQVSESLSDTLLDLAGYALLAYVETQKK